MMINRRHTLCGLAALAFPTAAFAAPHRYSLDHKNSTVGFSYVLNGKKANGRMPIRNAQILLDVDRPQNSEVLAEIDVRKADAGVFFATEAMLSQGVLNARKYPTIRFQSERVEGTVRKAVVHGKLTVRDTTRPAQFDAQVFRQRGIDEGDRSKLSILMTGEIDRRQFGAEGFSDLVGPIVGLEILARISLL